MVLETEPGGGAMRWTFSDIAGDSFSWSNATRRADATWEVTQRFAATRAGS